MKLRIHRAGFTGETVESRALPAACAGRTAGHAACWALWALLFAGATHANAGAAPGIVPDGGTHTTVTTASNGRQTVSIAPSVYGVSNNTYSNFNVSQAGATLDNTSANARTIVNQVTSTNPSLIEGDVTVLGSRANVVLANPNGITVNGGSFVNTGHVALATGQVSFSDVQLAPGQFQRNVLLNTQGGAITIGPRGLAGTLIGLELIAKQIQLNGPITNSFSSSTAYVRAIAGSSQTTLNTGVSPDDNNNDWLTLAQSQIANPNAIALEVESAGSITAGSIKLITTDLGAGVRSAGPLFANEADFTLNAAGDVQLLSGSSISATGNGAIQTSGALSLTAGTFKAGGDTSIRASGPISLTDGTVAAAGNASIQASGALSLTGAYVAAGAGSVVLSGSGVTAINDGAQGSTVASGKGGVLIQSTGDISLTSTLVQGATRIQNNSASLGAVTLSAAGNVTNASDTTQPSTLGVVFGQNDDVAINAGGNITNHNARIESNENVAMAAGGDIDNVIDHTSGVNNGVPTTYSDHGHRLLFLTANDDGFAVDYGSLPAPTQLSSIFADSGDVTLKGRNITNDGGSISSNAGKVTITAQQNVFNQAEFTGQASYRQSCFIFCHESASSTVQAFGGAIEADGDISITAGSQATNVGGNVYSFGGNVIVKAPTITARGVIGYTAYNRDVGLKAWFGNSWAAIYAADDGGLFEAASGQVTLVGQGVIDGGAFSGAQGVTATNGIVTIAPPARTPVTIGGHLGLVSWIGL